MYCKQCGNLIIENSGKCPKCNTKIGKGSRFCPDCGAAIKHPGDECKCKSTSSVSSVETPVINNLPDNTVSKNVVEREVPVNNIHSTLIKEELSENEQIKNIYADNPLLAKVAAKNKNPIANKILKQNNDFNRPVLNSPDIETEVVEENTEVLKDVPVKDIPVKEVPEKEVFIKNDRVIENTQKNTVANGKTNKESKNHTVGPVIKEQKTEPKIVDETISVKEEIKNDTNIKDSIVKNEMIKEDIKKSDIENILPALSVKKDIDNDEKENNSAKNNIVHNYTKTAKIKKIYENSIFDSFGLASIPLILCSFILPGAKIWFLIFSFLCSILGCCKTNKRYGVVGLILIASIILISVLSANIRIPAEIADSILKIY